MPRDVVNLKYSQASAKLSRLDADLYSLSNVWSQSPGQGHGRGIMEKVIHFADKHGLTLVLMVQQYGQPGSGRLSNEQLEQFYSCFGFLKHPNSTRPTTMYRRPLAKKTSALMRRETL